MIPNRAQAESLWNTYRVPEKKRNHLSLVADTAMALSDALGRKGITVQRDLLLAGALLHDIDKNVQKQAREKHPDAAVRILKQEGMDEVGELVRTHPLHSILDPAIAPKTWEEKLLYLSDKMVKDDIISVDERFRLWNNEHLPADEQKVLDESYKKVKTLEKEVVILTGMSMTDIAQVAKTEKKSTI